MTEEAERLATMLGRSQSDMLEFETGMAAVLQGAGLGGKAMQEMSGELTELSVRFGKFFQVGDQEAFDMIQGGLLGMGRTLQRYGVIVNESTLKEYAHSQGIKEKTEDMSEAQKMVLRYGLMMEQTTKAQGSGAKATVSFASEVKRFHAAWHDLLETVGKPALPILATAIQVVSGFLNNGLIPAIALAEQTLESFYAKVEQYAPGIAQLVGQMRDLGTMLTTDYHDIEAFTPQLGFEEIEKSKAAAEKNGTNVRAEFTKMQQAARVAAPDIKELYKQAAGGSGGAEKASGELKKVREAMEGLGEQYDEACVQIAADLTDLEQNHKEKMKGITDEIDGVTKSIARMKEQYDHTMDGFGQDEIGSVAKQIERVKDLKKELDSASFFAGHSADEAIGMLKGFRGSSGVEGDVTDQEKHAFGWGEEQAKQVNAAMKLAKEQAALDAVLKDRPDKDKLLAGASTESGKTDFEKEFAKIQEQKAWAKKQHEEEIKDKQDEIDKIREKSRVQQEEYTIQRQEMLNNQAALQVWHDDYVLKLQNMAAVTEEAVKGMKKNLEELSKTMSAGQAAAQAAFNVQNNVDTRRNERMPAKASGGVTTSAWTWVGENGPEAVRLPYGSRVYDAAQSQGMGGGVTVSIGAIHVHNEADEDRLVKKLTRQIQLELLSSS